MVNIAYYTEFNLQICNYAQKRRICRENCNYALDKIFMTIFAADERLPSPASLVLEFQSCVPGFGCQQQKEMQYSNLGNLTTGHVHEQR